MINLLYIDLFCGAGGTSTGINTARLQGSECAKVIACVNHDANAIASHASNHPDAMHFTEDIRTLELSPLVDQLHKCKAENPSALTVLWASLECTNFSKAKGGQPRDADSRTLAEHLYRYVETLDPDYIQIENVEEFQSWGDIGADGKPISKDRGRCYLRWISNIRKYGYNFERRIMNAADYGAYTSRKRFFGIFAKKGLPILWPEQTHCKRSKAEFFADDLEPWKPVKEVLDLKNEGESIFGRKKPLAERTLERIYAGLVKFVAGGKDAFLLKYNSMSQRGKYIAPSIDDPCPTVACQNRLGLAKVCFLSKQFSGDPYSKNSSVEEPAGTVTCIDHHAFISVYYSPGYNRGIEEPAPTLTTRGRLTLIQPVFISTHYGNGNNRSLEDPAPTVTTKDKLSIVKPCFLDNQYGNGRPSSVDSVSGCITTNPKQKLMTCDRFLMNPQYSSAGSSIDDPCFTLIARMDKCPPYLIVTESGEVAIEIMESDSEAMVKIKEFMALYGIIDIKMRMLTIIELKLIQGFPEDYVLIGTQAEQKKFLGNAVEVTIARKWCEALCSGLREFDLTKYHSKEAA